MALSSRHQEFPSSHFESLCGAPWRGLLPRAIRYLPRVEPIPGYRPATDPESHLQERTHHRPDPTASSRRGRLPRGAVRSCAVPARDELALPVAAALSDEAKEAIGCAIAASRSPNTRRNYQTAWRAWEDWARGRGHPPLPARAETVAAYLTERAAAGAGASTLGMALAAIAAAHVAAGETDPTRSEGVRRTVAGLRREAAGGAQRQARPLTETALAAIAASTPPTARGRTELARAPERTGTPFTSPRSAGRRCRRTVGPCRQLRTTSESRPAISCSSACRSDSISHAGEAARTRRSGG